MAFGTGSTLSSGALKVSSREQRRRPAPPWHGCRRRPSHAPAYVPSRFIPSSFILSLVSPGFIPSYPVSRGPFQSLVNRYKRECDDASAGEEDSRSFPAGRALSLLDAHASRTAGDREKAAFWTTVADLAKVLQQVHSSFVAVVVLLDGAFCFAGQA